jgi:hypothetical protein
MYGPHPCLEAADTKAKRSSFIFNPTIDVEQCRHMGLKTACLQLEDTTRRCFRAFKTERYCLRGSVLNDAPIQEDTLQRAVFPSR